MKRLFKIISNPLARFGIGFVSLFLCAGSAALFPPLAYVFGPFVFWILMLGNATDTYWYDSDVKEECALCGEKTGIKLVKVKHSMYAFIPLSLILQLCYLLRVPYFYTYYKVCENCKEAHIKENNFNAMQTIAKGGLITMQEISRKEFKALLKK